MAVVHSYPEFKQPLDVLNRYEALGKIEDLHNFLFFYLLYKDLKIYMKGPLLEHSIVLSAKPIMYSIYFVLYHVNFILL
jgi:hypothetical protein